MSDPIRDNLHAAIDELTAERDSLRQQFAESESGDIDLSHPLVQAKLAESEAGAAAMSGALKECDELVSLIAKHYQGVPEEVLNLSDAIARFTIPAALASAAGRDLLAQLADKEADLKISEERIALACGKCEQLKSQLAEAQVDKDRIDWLNTGEGMDWFTSCDYGDATREAIDIARGLKG